MYYSFKQMQQLNPIPLGTKVIVKDKHGMEEIGILENYNYLCSWIEDTANTIKYLEEPEYANVDGNLIAIKPRGAYFLPGDKVRFKKYGDTEITQLSLF